jgi:hypothetical protein
MSQEVRQGAAYGIARPWWQAGAVGGLVAGVIMGLLMQVLMPGVISVAIPALYGLEGAVAGWLIHLVNSLIFGALFGVAVSRGPLVTYGRRIGLSTGLGIAYGILVWFVAAGFVMPVWLQSVGFAGAPPVPNLAPMSLIIHVVFGAILGAIYPVVRRD